MFEIREAGRLIGHSAFEHFDTGMGVATGAFIPAEGYARVRPIFRLFAEASSSTSAEPEDEAKMTDFRRAADQLRLELIGPQGELIPTTFVHIYDFSVEGGADAYEVEAQVSNRAAWKAVRRS